VSEFYLRRGTGLTKIGSDVVLVNQNKFSVIYEPVHLFMEADVTLVVCAFLPCPNHSPTIAIKTARHNDLRSAFGKLACSVSEIVVLHIGILAETCLPCQVGKHVFYV
jgi:hypothetical protein